ncbi:LysR substrate-binding domain-containing protein, partial [Vibrio parahaemolyticus]
ALRQGLGIGCLPDFIVDGDLARGTLVPILTDWRLPPSAIHLMTPPGALRPARVEALLTYLAENLRRICPS